MDLRVKMTSRGRMGIIILDDGSCPSLEVTVYSEVFDAHRNKLKVDEPLIIEGKVSKDDFRDGLRIVAENLYTLPEARTRFAPPVAACR